jgi:hypothetical protein
MKTLSLFFLAALAACQSTVTEFPYTWRGRQFDTGYHVSFIYHDYPSQWQNRDWQTASERSACAAVLADFKRRGIAVDDVFVLSSGMEQGGSVGIGMLVGGKNFCSKWRSARKENIDNRLIEITETPWTMSCTGSFNVGSN